MGSNPSVHRTSSSMIKAEAAETNTSQESNLPVDNDPPPSIIKQGPGPGEIDVGSYRINLDDIIGKGTFGSVCMAHVIDTGLPIAY